MATQEVKVVGTAMYPKVFERNRDKASFHEDTDGACTIDVVLEKEEFDKLKASGFRGRPSVTDEGMSVKFRRKWKDPVSDDFGGAPQVVDREGQDWDDSVSIGNGSKVSVAVDVYDTSMGKGARLTGVQVLELIEYATEDYQKKLPF